jgi:hypothetical protein
MNASALFAIGCWLAIIGGLGWGFSSDVRQWYRRQCLLENINAQLDVLFSDPLWRKELRRGLKELRRGLIAVEAAEAPTEDIEEALLIANGWGPTFDKIQALSEFRQVDWRP